MDKQVPLLTAEMAKRLMNDDPRRDLVRIESAACDALEAIESGDAVVVPKGMREAVLGVAAELRGYLTDDANVRFVLHAAADNLQRALNGEKS